MTHLAPNLAQMESPRISIVLATYNRGFLLPRTLPTVYQQDIPRTDYELIVVVDGSSDGTVEYLRSVKPPCRMLVIEQPNRGAAAARNAGLRQARGAVVLLMDDDLLCPPWLLRHHIEAHRGHAKRVVYGATNTAEQSPSTLATDLTRKSSAEATARLDSGAPRPGAELALDPNCSLPRSLIMEIGGFDESFQGSRETNELALRLRSVGAEFHYIRDTAVDEVYVKSAKRLGFDDAFAAGVNEVRLRRKHPRYKPESVLANMAEGSALRRSVRRAAATLPGADFLVSLSVQFFESFRMIPQARDAGIQLLRWRQAINLYRGAVSATGSWHRLADEFGATFPCLIYHHIGPSRRDTYPELTIAPARFERHLQWLRGWGYQGITPSQWARWRTGHASLPRRPVILTFDDGYADTAEHAFPLLKRYGFPATVFAVAGELGGTNRWDEHLGSGSHRLMDEDQIRNWAANGIEFGAHSLTHPDLTCLPAQQARHEIERSRDLLADVIGQPITSFSYPYGYHDGQTEAIARSCFELAFTTLEGRNSLATNSHRLRRTMVLPDDRRGDLFSRLRLGYSLRHRSVGRLVRLRSWFLDRIKLRVFGMTVSALRSAWYLTLELKSMVGKTSERRRARFEKLFVGKKDPWEYQRDAHQRRFQRELHMILTACNDRRIGSALEIGCAEGAFTELVAEHCDSLLAVDISATALNRARLRVAWPAKVQFRELDIVCDSFPQSFDLIIIADVVDYIALPWRNQAIRQKLIAALEPGGLLLVGSPMPNSVIENSWWGRLLVRGGTWISLFISQDSALELVAQTKTESRIDSLFRRRRHLEPEHE
jgi:peptidoglycan/xylan/chitin deacetylase (PgdA/CDA1 family)/glycosyltransferase involved in cell wall biosynthesis/SAM-dependent methyltransferase